ncbi:ankyrin repeat domain-containing protein, chloroplastic [Trichoderma asperellum]|uniref:Ankyrin repeat domain-containing protein, chloroplastic n=1 Tax=Trichoderma asperellum TaxID=101201 RepID=A0A6V8R4G2_TRIAP|nr:ankyrin repeat domain-containing protein, chloroplastic [Trichoderma asperellum]
MPSFTPNERQRRIVQLSQQWGVALPPVPPPLSRPMQPPSFRTAADDEVAEGLIQRQAADSAKTRPKSGLSRAFSSSNLKKGKGWDAKDVLDVLAQWIANSGSPGVAEALISKLTSVGVDLTGSQQQKSGILSRRKSLDGFDGRSQLLRSAVERNLMDMVRVLLPHADSLALDASLPVAIRNGNAQIVENLLRYGANASRLTDAQTAFRHACSIPGLSGIVSLVLQSEGRPPAALVSDAMIDAARAGNLQSVLYLSRSIADGNHKQAEALRLAVDMGRKDIAVAIIMGNQPPQRPGVDNAFQAAFEHPSMNPDTKLEFAELLLCAGAGGDFLSQALELSCETQFYDMANMLAMYGASIESNDASMLKGAIARGQLDLVNSLLQDRTALSPPAASGCVSAIPKQAAAEVRYTLLCLLLKKGANGDALNQALIDAVEAGDVNSVELLLNPYFTTAQTNGVKPMNGGRHAVASVDYQNGRAVCAAIIQSNVELTRKLLAARASANTLATAFPLTMRLSGADRYHMAELFLKRSLPAASLHAALQDAIGEDRSKRDGALINLLLQHDADVNFNKGAGLSSLIVQKDVNLLVPLLRKASPQTAAARTHDVMRVDDHRARFDMMGLLFQAGAASGVVEIATALLETLSEKPVDMSLLQLLLQQGNADVNALDGAIATKATQNPDPKVLEMVINLGKPASNTITKALQSLASIPPSEGKTFKLRVLLPKSEGREELNGILAQEVQFLARDLGRQQAPLTTLEILLESGADPNAYKAASLCHAVMGGKIQIVDLLFGPQCRLNQVSLGYALPHALRLQDAMNRLTLAKRLVEAGVSPQEVNRALIHAIKTYPSDFGLIRALASKADTADGEALSLAISKESVDVTDILLTAANHSMENRSLALTRAMDIKNRPNRNTLCQRLLAYEISPTAASNALLVAAREGDVKLGDILMSHGASMSQNNGQAVIEACRGGSVEVLKVLLGTDMTVNNATLEEGFQAATEVGDLNKRAMIFEQILSKGLRGELVDAQLESAARYGEDGQAMLRVLLVAGADPNYANGEAVVAATRSAFIKNLELLLGLWGEGDSQKKASPPTLVRALKACWNLNRDTRYLIIVDLMKAGLPVAEDLHITLNDAVNEENSEERLVKLLLDYGASPLANGCKTLVDAAEKALSSSLALLLDIDIPQNDIDMAFSNSFKAEKFDTWFTQSGLETANMLLDKGATGNALSEALIQVMKSAESPKLADQFFNVLTAHDPDVNYEGGEPLRLAASQANIDWTHRLLACHPSTETLTFAFHCIFDTELTQDVVLEFFQMFADYHEGDVRVDVMATRAGHMPVLGRAISQYPRSSTILTTLLDAGYYYDQSMIYKLHPEIEEEEEMTLLTWAIAQPQKKVTKVNIGTKISGTTPLMLAVRERRPDIVKLLLLEGADVDAMDFLGRTPMAMVTHLSGEVAIQMMSSLLAAEPSKDDGSLHNAARDLNLPAVKVLMEAGHDPDFPSPLHNGRSALGEVCLHGSDAGEMTPERERKMQKVMTFLVDAGSDLSIKLDGKSILYLCFDSTDPVATTRALLKSGMWKHINKPSNQYADETFVYSPTMYITKLMPALDAHDQLLSVLRASRATDVYYAKEGAQPEGAVGLPEDIEVRERVRKARSERLAEESQDFAMAMARKREIASVDQQIQIQKAEMEDARRRRLQSEDFSSIRAKAQLEESLANDAFKRRLAEQRAVTEATLASSRALAASDLEAEEARQRKALEWENKLNSERAGNARALIEMRIGEREELERIDVASEQRIQRRLEAQRRLVESQEKLARRLADAPTAPGDPRRQIGYVTELN